MQILAGKDLIIFDLDGTLVDSVNQIIQSVNSSRADFGYEQRSPDEIFNLIGLPPAHFFSDLLLQPAEVDKLVMLFRQILDGVEFSYLNVYPGVLELLRFLEGNNFSLAVATNKPTQNAKRLLEKVGLLQYFTLVQGSDQMLPKPSPEIINKVLNDLNPFFAVMIGDRTEDIESAKSAGIKAIGVSQTAHNEEDLKEAGAFLAFSSMAGLCKSIKDLMIIDTLRG